ncbi:MAG: N-acetylmuramoyl-L-alanine amidase [Bacteroidetes bacterium]|nr:N-acetylmuramoyl-L-alanine amidase [Bacteroidota bacterium]
MNFITIFLKITAASGLLYGYYYCFLRNRVFHGYNRFYLLLAALVAAASPFISIPLPLSSGPEETGLAKTLHVIATASWDEHETAGTAGTAAAGWPGWEAIALFLYIAGLATGLVVLLRSFWYIIRVSRRHHSEPVSGIRLYDTAEPGAPFSFFRLVFWHRDIPFASREGQQVFRHELYHVRQGHSFDILLMELLCCAAWFNPFFHLIKKELKVLHEFLADQHSADGQDRHDYAGLLLELAIRQRHAGLTHSFSNQPIKRRIMMLTSQTFRRRGGYLSRVLVLPLLLIILGAFALKPVYTHVHANGRNTQPLTVVIDAGHGGVDPGAQVDGLAEKDLTLALARKVQSLAPQYGVRVIMTREKDELPGGGTDIRAGLLRRTEIVQKEHADLFISLHVNLSGNGKSEPAGIEAYIGSRKEDKKTELLAGTLLQKLGQVYTASAEIRKRSVQSIWVLDNNSKPAVLLECGNMSNAADRAFISEEKNQEKLAEMLLQGIVDYSKL